jgi:hypothetical protein
MRFLTRFAKPYRATKAFEWAESCDLLLARKLGKDTLWLDPFEPPHRNELTSLNSCFNDNAAQKAVSFVTSYQAEIARLPPALSINGYFGPADVAFYWAFIRSRCPETVIEVGSGYSSRVALRALAKNCSGRLICIDPSPRLNLPTSNLTHMAAKIEEIDPILFEGFKQNDILFIDSSHTGAEARNHAAILDRLPVGALVHYHDIDYPWNRQQPDWDEDVVLNEFLAVRPNWKVMVSGSILSLDYLAQLCVAIPHYSRTPFRRYNGLWMTKTA